MLSVGFALVVLLCGLLLLLLWEERRRAAAQPAAATLAGWWKGRRERRRCPRLRLALSVRYDVLAANGSGTDPQGEAVSDNVSDSGICLRLYERLTPPARLKLAIQLPRGAEPIRGVGEVRWTCEEKPTDGRRTFLAGIHFLQISPTDHERLAAVLKQTQPSQ